MSFSPYRTRFLWCFGIWVAMDTSLGIDKTWRHQLIRRNSQKYLQTLSHCQCHYEIFSSIVRLRSLRLVFMAWNDRFVMSGNFCCLATAVNDHVVRIIEPSLCVVVIQDHALWQIENNTSIDAFWKGSHVFSVSKSVKFMKMKASDATSNDSLNYILTQSQHT